MRVSISTGLGRLHFIGTVNSMYEFDVQYEVISGWLPKPQFKFLVNTLGLITNTDRLYKRLSVRAEFSRDNSKIHSDFVSEFIRYLIYVPMIGSVLPASYVIRHSWILFGKRSCKHVCGEIFHVRSAAGQGEAISRAKLKGIKIIVDQSIAHPEVIKSNVGEYWSNSQADIEQALDDLILADCNAADTILVNSDYVKRTFVENGFNPAKIEVIYLGVDHDLIPIKTDYNRICSSQIVILFSGTFSFRKGAATLMEAVRILKIEGGVDCRVLVAGSVGDSASLLSRYPDLKDQFLFFGHLEQSEVFELFNHSDVYVFPSNAEGCAKSLCEAMSSGIPVITTIESGAPIENMRTGLLVDRNNSNQLANAINLLGNDGDLRKKVGTSGSKFARKNFTWDLYGKKLYKLYTSLVAQ